MWKTLMFINLGALLITVSSSPPSPNIVNFTSVNLRNILRWLPGNGTQGDTHFTVQYAIYGVSVVDSKGKQVHWRAVTQCTKITRNWCDLSNETWDLEHGYYARVRALKGKSSSKWAMTGRFDPKLETTFGPPIVSVEVEDNTAVVTLKGPMRYQPNNHSPAVSMTTFYPQMMYNLSINRSGLLSHLYAISSPFKYRLTEYDTEYCFSAASKFHSLPLECHLSGWHCITSPSDPVFEQIKKMSVGIAVAMVFACVLLLVGYIGYEYLTGDGQKIPYVLKAPSFHTLPLTAPHENLNIILISILKPSDNEGGVSEGAKNPPQPFVNPPPGYAPQRSDASRQPEGSEDNGSVVYGFVGAAPEISVENGGEENERRHDRGENWVGHQRCVARESYEEKLFRVNPVVNPQAQSYLSQISTHTFLQTSSPKQEMLLSFQSATEGEVDRGGRHVVSGLFHGPSNPHSVKEEGMEEEINGVRVRVIAGGEIDSEIEMERRSETAPLLSGYASQNVVNVPRSHFDQSQSGVLRQRTEEDDEMAEEEEEEEEEEVGNICVEWDPETRKLMLPELAMEGGSDVLRQGEKKIETREEGEKEQRKVEEGEISATQAKLTLENVYVRQGSEEEAEARRERGAGGWDVDDILTKWDLVIPMEE